MGTEINKRNKRWKKRNTHKRGKNELYNAPKNRNFHWIDVQVLFFHCIFSRYWELSPEPLYGTTFPFHSSSILRQSLAKWLSCPGWGGNFHPVATASQSAGSQACATGPSCQWCFFGEKKQKTKNQTKLKQNITEENTAVSVIFTSHQLTWMMKDS